MTDIKYDPELPFVVRIRFSQELLGRFSDVQDAEQIADSIYGGYDTEVIDTTPKPKIPDDAEFIVWNDPSDNGEERIARRYGHTANKVWRIGWDTIEESELMSYIGDAEVTVLVRKEDS